MDIKQVRLGLGWSQKRLADYLGVDYHTIGNWEAGRTEPPRLAVEKIEQLTKKGWFSGFIDKLRGK